ncbi:MAG: nuclear transport factor 2 family protein [Paracoccus sp. (in: a-proteobacteria)]|uniref:nuclear transport factor 2 family protein n=1 Tax=Paracoccus sp. TaxID=267 RepID=UPI0026E01691|nr:nuclear transport factor 2 family protein [Paracoccus sp. (in: a-proteobacteria)]MDO5614141.1 nuclear transport factor 2 family protein [Paracoccus sp. (in: a-proteobacteria)]
MTAGGAALVRAFWSAMNGNDWGAVAERFLAPDFTAFWPQSAEVIEGRDAFARINAAFPGQGGWRFQIVSLLADSADSTAPDAVSPGNGDNIRVVTDTRITQADHNITARVITFHDIAGGLIRRQTEFWPDPYPVPEWRRGMLTLDPQRARF